MPDNLLHDADNLDVLRRYLKGETIDLIYIGPPFNSKRNYNVLCTKTDVSLSAAQIKAFGDTWRWDQGAAAAFEEVIVAGGKVSEVIDK